MDTTGLQARGADDETVGVTPTAPGGVDAGDDETGTVDDTTASDAAAGDVAPDGTTVADAAAADDEPVPAEAEATASPEIARWAAVIEGMLFAAAMPVPPARLVEALQGPSRADVQAALRHLAARLEGEERGLRLVHVAGGYQLRTATAHGPWIRRLLNARPPRLSRPMLETLAIVAYRQPCTRIEIEAIRGVDADATLTTLIERRMVRILGRKEAPGRPILYGTTRDFLEVFGLPDLSALPALPELAEAATLLAAADPAMGEGGATAAVPEVAAAEPAAAAPPAAEAAPDASPPEPLREVG